MNTALTAIIHLREPFLPVARLAIEPTLRAIKGVDGLYFEPEDAVIAVDFDGEQTTIAEIVRVIEDSGRSVSGVAQRQNTLRQAG